MASGLELGDIVADPGVSGSAPMFERSGGRWFICLGAGDAVIEAKLDCVFRSAPEALRTVEV